MKKIIALLLTCIMVLGMFAACGTPDTPETTAPKGNDTPDTPDATNAPVQTVVIDTTVDHSLPYYQTLDGWHFTTWNNDGANPYPEGMDPNNNPALEAFTLKTGATCEIIWAAAGEAYDEKRNAAIATGELPDVFEVSLAQYQMLVEADLIEDLTDVIDEWMSPELKQACEDGGAFDTITIGGRLYGVPNPFPAGDGTPMFWIRTDWLEKLQLEKPETLDDLAAIAKAFMAADFDGNGIDDTYGIPFFDDFSSSYGGTGNFCAVMQQFGANVGTWYINDDGKVVRGDVDEDALDALKYLNGWYKEGIIPQDFATWDGDTYAAAVANGMTGIQVGPWWDGYGWPGSALAMDENARWEPFLLSLEEGEPVVVPAGGTVGSIWCVPKGAKHAKEMVILQNIEYASSADCNTVEGFPDWTGAGLMAMHYPIRQGASPTSMKAQGAVYYGTSTGIVTNEEECKAIALENNLQPKQAGTLWTGAQEFAQMYNAENPAAEGMPWPYTSYISILGMVKFYTTDYELAVNVKEVAGEEWSTYGSGLGTMRTEAYVKMIMGETDGLSLDDFWKNYVDTWYASGGEEVTAEAQAYVDAK